jgi:formylglycine-generating enzyme required for sulfatase activity
MKQTMNEVFGTSVPDTFFKDIIIPEQMKRGVVKCRILYGKSIDEVEFQHYTCRKVASLKLVDAVDYCNWLSKKNGLKPVYKIVNRQYVCDFNANGYRLPTEAEWEFAAKGGNVTKDFKYSGHDRSDVIAWYKKNSDGGTHPVGTKLANELGIYDMSGNVWEWCWDWYNKDFYLTESGDNPKGPERGTERCLRGGSWDSSEYSLRSANRLKDTPYKKTEFYGFRLARTVN